MSLLGNSLFTTTQQNVLTILYGQPNKSFYTKEILRLTKMGVATIKRELDRMLKAGILTMRKIGNQHHYQANPDCPIFNEVLGIVNKTFGLADVIKIALIPLKDKIDCAFIFGSVAKSKETNSSDIDLMIIGDVSFGEVIQNLFSVQESLRRDINPKVYIKSDWNQLIENKDAFIKEVLSQPKINLIGHCHES